MADRSSSRLGQAAPLVVAWLAVAAFEAIGCSKPAADEEIASPEVPTISAEVGTVERRDLVEALLVRGAVVAMPNADVRLSAQVAGRVVSLRLAEGDAVRAGEVVAEIESRSLADQVRQARAGLAEARVAQENARLRLERTERLFERGIAAGQEAEDARSQRAAADAGFEQASAGLDAAEHQLSRARLVSPIAGQVVRRFVAVGDAVDGTAAQPLVEVADVTRVEVAAQVAAEHLGRVRVGQAATVSIDGTAERELPGEVVAIAPAVDPATNAALVRIRVRNGGRLLRIGMFAEARVAIQVKRGVLVAPASALSRGSEGVALYVVSGAEVLRTSVRIGLETPAGVEVVSGVAEGASVLVSGIHGLGARARLSSRP